ncbi:glycosidase/chitodextrinase [Paenibacillus sp. DS2015]|uniref:family 14 glycosylhydrolase n=1 Tax=Paenibacillus sp. DS2015 TaxID=3373917 RepID=UPI003D1A0D56
MNSSRMFWRKARALALGFILVFSTITGLFTGSGTASADVANDFKASVMAPLSKITDWNAFRNQLQTLKNNGVYGITTDVWWGDVEAAGDNQFDWSYYKTYANVVSESGLKWVPILSTHTCGGNPGDDCNIPIPSWLWNKGSADEMKYKSETGFVNNEALSPFWSGISQQYSELYTSFASNFASYKALIPKIYLSAGPSGELRYPSYYNSAGWNYPSRGKFQVYTDTAKNAFRTAMVSKYGSLTGVNQAWGLSLTNASQINPPSDGDSFYSTGGYNTNYGKDFLKWNQGVLENHLGVIATAAHNSFDSVFGVRIGAKISGIHWQYNNPSAPHSAENAAGYYDYNTLIQKFKDSNLDLTFTALEMNNDGSSPAYSMPSTLVDTVSSIANSKGVRLNGENALPTGNFQKVQEKITQWKYNGFTLLRLANLVNSNGSATGDMAGFKQYVISHTKDDVDTTAPSIPTNLVSTGKTSTSISLGWTASSDAVGVTGYEIWRNGTKVGTSAATSYTNTGLTANTAYSYTVKAYDAAGNISNPSTALPVTTNPIVIDTIAPSIPTSVVSTSKTDTTVSLSWTASSDVVGVTGYEIWRDGAKVGTSTSTSYTNIGLTASTAYSYTVKAYDAAGNISDASTAFSVTTNDVSAGNQVTVYYKKGYATPYIHYRPAGGTWTTAPGTAMLDSELSGYSKIIVNIGSASQLEAVFNNGSGTWDNNNSTNYLFNVGTWTFTPGSNGAAGSISAGPVQGTDDTTAPSVPTNVVSTAKTETSVSLSWTASSDVVGVTGYEIWRDGAKVGTSTSTSYTNIGLTASTAYSYTVKAYDAAGNISDASTAFSVTTNDVSAGNQVTVYYKKGYATPYIHYRPAGGTWTTAPGTAMLDSELSGYSKITVNIGSASQLEAVFNNGSGTWDNNNSRNYLFNIGTWTFTPSSNGAAGSISAGPVQGTDDTTAPSVPTNVVSSAKTETSVSLSWTASSDVVGVTGYEIWRDGAKVGTSTSTTYTNTGLTANTAYSYTVKAYDAAGNISDASTAFSVTTNNVSTGKQVTVYYKKGYATPYIHYRPAGGTWTTAPGTAMLNSELSGYSKITVNIGSASQLEAVFNNGSGTWDNNNSRNYLFNIGTWTFTPGSNGAAGSISAGPVQGTDDTTAPSVPTNVVSSAKTETSVSLSWTASSDVVGVTGYEIWRDGAKVGTSTSTTYTNTGLTANTAYSYTVKAYDAAGNISDASTAFSVTTNNVSTGKQVTVYYKKGYATPYIHYRPAGGTWTTAPGTAMLNSELSGYSKITVNIGSASQLEAVFNNGSGTWDNNNSINYLFNVGTWTFTPGSNGAAGTISAGAPIIDNTTPSIPTNVVSTSKTGTTISFSWTASPGAVGYEIWRNGSKVGTTSSTSYTDTGLSVLTTYTYTVKAYNSAGNTSGASAPLNVTTDSSTNQGATDWSKQSIYFIMTDRFVNGDTSNDNFDGFNSNKSDPKKWHGGDFQGVINQLDYIKNLGFTAIWITPVTLQKGDYAYHGYHTYDFYSVDGHLGSMNKFKELVNTAHNKGIAVMLDVVPNHTGDFQPNGFAKAPFNNYDWYHHNGEITGSDYNSNNQWKIENGDVAGLDDLNQDNPAVTAELNNWIKWLINESKVDGLRVDTAKHVSKGFLKSFDNAANIFTIGEIFDGSPTKIGDYSNYLDAVLDFPMYYTMQNVFGHDGSMTQIRDRYAQDSNYRDVSLNGTFIDNHDVKRFLNDASGKPGNGADKWPQLKAALGFMLTSRGIPILYQGTELGYSGGDDPYNREDVVPNANHELYKYIAKINAVRNSHPALQNGTQKERWADSTFYSFQRSKGGDEAIVMINNSWNTETRTIGNFENLSNGLTLKNQLGTDSVQLNNGTVTVTLAPKEVKIFTK